MHREESLHTIASQSPSLWSDMKRVSMEVGYLPMLGQSRNVHPQGSGPGGGGGRGGAEGD